MYRSSLSQGHSGRRSRFAPKFNSFNKSFNPQSYQPGVLVRISNGAIMPAPNSFQIIGWRDHNFVGRVISCTEFTAKIRRANGTCAVIFPTFYSMRVLSQDEAKAATAEFPKL